MSGRFPGKPLYVPETMPIAEIMKNMEKRGRLKLTIKGQTEEGLAANINQKGPASTATNLRPGDEFDGSIVTLSVNDIQPYDRNPRTSPNPQGYCIRRCRKPVVSPARKSFTFNAL